MAAIITIILLALEVLLVASYALTGYPESMTTNFFIVQSILLPLLTNCIKDYIKLSKEEHEQAKDIAQQSLARLPTPNEVD